MEYNTTYIFNNPSLFKFKKKQEMGDHVHWNYDGHMDYLYDKKLSDVTLLQYNNSEIIIKNECKNWENTGYSSWIISLNMLVKINKPIYKPRKLIRD